MTEWFFEHVIRNITLDLGHGKAQNESGFIPGPKIDVKNTLKENSIPSKTLQCY